MKHNWRLYVSAAWLWLLIAYPSEATSEHTTGWASWYGSEACRVNPDPRCPTASGEPFDPSQLTAAMWGAPFGSQWRICSQAQPTRCTVVRITDRGPAKRLHRIIDLSQRAFQALAPLSAGVIRVSLTRLLASPAPALR